VRRLARALLVLTLIAVVAAAPVWPRFFLELSVSGNYSTDGKWRPLLRLPVGVSSEVKTFEGLFKLHLPVLYPRKYSVHVDDCLAELSVNGQSFAEQGVPFCDFGKARVVSLHNYLKPGENLIWFKAYNRGGVGGFDLRASARDWTLIFYWGLSILTVLLALTLLSRITGLGKSHFPFMLVFALGYVLRLIYLFVTPYGLRGHDTEAHIQYIEHVLQHWTVPQASQGWQYYQPPLYYFLSALWLKLSAWGGFSQAAGMFGLQVAAFILSLVALAVSLALIAHSQRSRGDSSVSVAAGIFLAALPSLVFFATRINNDVLLQVLSLTALACFFCFLSDGASRYWWLGCCFTALALLTKTNAVIVAPLAVGALVLRSGFSWRRRLAFLLGGLALVAALSAPYYRLRYEQPGGSALVGNIGNLSDGLKIPNDRRFLITFNPFKVLEKPFNNAWEDSFRRAYFWEYLYRSAFFGEFNFEPALHWLGSALLLLSFQFWPLFLIGLYRALRSRWREGLFFLLAVLSALVSHLALRLKAPYSCSQDFRYITVVMLPVCYFLACGLNSLGSVWRGIFTYLAWSFAVLSTCFFLILYWQVPGNSF